MSTVGAFSTGGDSARTSGLPDVGTISLVKSRRPNWPATHSAARAMSSRQAGSLATLGIRSHWHNSCSNRSAWAARYSSMADILKKLLANRQNGGAFGVENIKYNVFV